MASVLNRKCGSICACSTCSLRLGHLALERGAVDFGPMHRLGARHFTPIELADDSQHSPEKGVPGPHVGEHAGGVAAGPRVDEDDPQQHTNAGGEDHRGGKRGDAPRTALRREVRSGDDDDEHRSGHDQQVHDIR